MTTAAATDTPRDDKRPDFGGAVVDGFLRYTSVSAVQTFDPDTYAGCHRRYFFTRVLGHKEPTTKSQAIGHEGHAQLEHYEKTGEDVLQPLARAGKHFLPRPGSDLLIEGGFASEENTKKAIALREALRTAPANSSWESTLRVDIDRIAGLSAAGVPFVGYIDLMHSRGEYIDERGELVREEDPEHTIEIVDYKFSSDINTFGKSIDEIVNGIQMTGYTVHGVKRFPYVTRVRDGHIYFQTRGARCAKKLTKLVVVDDKLFRRWERVEGVVEVMKQVVQQKRVEDVEANIASCDAYRGCHFRSICPNRPARGIHDLLKRGDSPMGTGLFGAISIPESTPPALPSVTVTTAPPALPASMGLFGAVTNTPASNTPPPLPTPPISDAEFEARKQAEIARLTATPSTSLVACGAPGCGVGCQPGWVFNGHGAVTCTGCAGKGRLVDRLPTVQAVPTIGQVNPPDSPNYTTIVSAAALPAAVIQNIEDPELKARAEKHASDVQAEEARKKAAEDAEKAAAGTAPKTSGNCSGGKQRLQLNSDAIANRQMPCPVCGKVLKLKPAKEGEVYVATLPGHRIPQAEAAAAPDANQGTGGTGTPPPLPSSPPPLPTGAVPPLPYIAPGALPGQTAMTQVVPPLPTSIPPLPSHVPPLPSGIPALPASIPPLPVFVAPAIPALPAQVAQVDGSITLYIDVFVDKGDSIPSLEPYVHDLVDEIARNAGIADIRIADTKHELGYTRWRGYLTACVKAAPPKPGSYTVRNVATSEILQVAAEAVAALPNCTRVFRGSK